jgi:predicted esterase YcpF (UPF0227 family)
VLLQTGDEVLDYRHAKNYFRGHKVVVEEGGTHRFEHFAAHLPQIEAFRREAAAS